MRWIVPSAVILTAFVDCGREIVCLCRDARYDDGKNNA